MDPQQQFFQALSALRAGDLDGCETVCKTLLAINPREVNTLRLNAQVLERRGELTLAVAEFNKLLAIAPDFAHAWADLGRVQQSLGELENAEQSLRRALRLDNKLKAPAKLLQRVLEDLGKTAQSAEVGAINRRHAELKNKVQQAFQLTKDGDAIAAEKLCLEVLAVDADNVGAKELLIDRALETDRARWAEEMARGLIRKMPERPKWWLKLAASLSRQDQMLEAEEAARQVLKIDRDPSEGRMMLGAIYSKDNRFADALAQYDMVLEQRPDYVAALSQKATALKTLGHQQQAIDAYQRCLELEPTFAEAAWSLSNLKTYRFSDSEVEGMQAILAAERLAEKSLADKAIVQFNYALGKAYEQRQDWDQAFACYAAGNAIQKQLVKWDADKFSQLVDNIIASFSTEFVAAQTAIACPDPAPIFVLGLPRSGSTLQEQILASHSQVEGTRELPYIPSLANHLHRPPNAMASTAYPAAVTQLNGEQWRQLGEQFMQRAQRHRQTDAPFFIDKLPNNFLYVGLILMAMPKAKIINTQRNPIDNCFGCFKQLWAEGQNFTYDLVDLGRYYRDYYRLMNHWQQVFPEQIYSVNYEAVVADLETNIEALLTYCGLPMEQQCLRFHETQRAVNTASSEQVRQPLYASAVAYWKHFDAHLQPLKDALGDLAEA
ncbi:sulfotransferase [Porticoccaceae bacterium]|nr:sulfotransferase [Porticoccaceae bacterium]